MMNQFFKGIFSFEIFLTILLLLISSCKLDTLESSDFIENINDSTLYDECDQENVLSNNLVYEVDVESNDLITNNTVYPNDETTSNNTEDIGNVTHIDDRVVDSVLESTSSNDIIVLESGYASINLNAPINEADIVKLKSASIVDLFIESPVDFSQLFNCTSIKTLMVHYFQTSDEFESININEIMRSGIEEIYIDGGGLCILLDSDLSFNSIKEINITNADLKINGKCDFPDLIKLSAVDVEFDYANAFLPFASCINVYLRNCIFAEENENCLSVCHKLQELSFIDCDLIICNFNELLNLSSVFLYNESGSKKYNVDVLNGMKSIKTIRYGFNLFNTNDIELLKKWYPNIELVAIGGI